jgi:hypothetical protein
MHFGGISGMKLKELLCLTGLMAASLALGLLFIFQGTFPAGMVQDGGHYEVLAKSLLQQGTFPSAYRSPGYPFFVAVMYGLFGEGTLPIFLVQAVLFSVTTGLLFLLGRDILGEQRAGWAFVPAVLVGLNPEFAAYSAVMLRECMTMFLLVLASWLCLRMLTWRWWYGFGVGVCVAGLAYIRQEACLLIFVMMAIGLFHKGWRDRDLAGGSLAVAIILGCTLPWIIYCGKTRGYMNMQDATDSNLFVRTWYFSAEGKSEPDLRKYIGYIIERNHLSAEQVRRYTIAPILVSELPEGDVHGEVMLYRQLGRIARENLQSHKKAYVMDSLTAMRVSMGGYWLEWWQRYWEAPAFSENIRQGDWLMAGVKIANRVVWPVVVLLGCFAGVVGLWRKRDAAAWPVTMLLIGTVAGMLPATFLVEGAPRLRMVYDGFLYLGMISGIMMIKTNKCEEEKGRKCLVQSA